MELDRTELNNLANFFARRFPQADERQRLTAHARFLYAETGNADPVEAWSRLLTEASQRRVLPALAWAAIQARQKDKNLQEVATVLGARPPVDGLGWGSPLVVNAVAGAFLVGLALIGFVALRSERQAEATPLLDPGLAAAAEAPADAPPPVEAPVLDAGTPVAPPPSTSTGTASFTAVAAPAAPAEAPAPPAAEPVKAAPPVAKAEPAPPAETPKAAPAKVEAPAAAPPKAEAPKAAPVAKVEAPPPAKAAPAKVAAVAKVEAPAVSGGPFPKVAPAATPAGRCKTKEGGFVGYWYAGEANPGRVGQIVTMDRSANVRETYPHKDNGYDFSSSLRCSLVPGDKVRISGAPIAVDGGSYWVPLLATDFNPAG